MATHGGATMWGGRFEGAADPLFRAFNDSLSFDWTLVTQDIAGSIAWAGALRDAGVLTREEAGLLVNALEALALETAAMDRAPVESGAEDVHSWVEMKLVERVGALGKKLHTGRSRNDQVATDLRLWVRNEVSRRVTEIHAAQRALLALARRHEHVPLPGYTHLQRGQPVSVAHWCLAYVEMLERDAGRLLDARRRMNACPLGSGALAGTAYPIDRSALADALGFDRPTPNSLDAVSDRDFVAEALAALAVLSVHLSRLAEDVIVYASSEFGLVRLSDAVSSGSSLMPQKKNPDALELLRGKSGRIIGALVGLLTVMKGLPLAYNKDQQEDKEGVFDAMRSASMCLRMLVLVAEGMTFDEGACRKAALGGYSNATELADYLVGKGMAFRDAHDAAGRVVRKAIEKGAPIEGLSLEELRAVSAQIEQDVYACLTVEAALARRDVVGGPAPGRVAKALAEAEARLAPALAETHAITTRKALAWDAEAIAEVVNSWSGSGQTIAREASDVSRSLRQFTVAVRAGATGEERVVGCGSLVVGSDHIAEIRSLAVCPEFTRQGVGSALARRLCEDGRRLGLDRVFVLTCEPEFFARLGFRRVEQDALGEMGASAWSRRDRSKAEWRFMAWECDW